MLEAHGTVGGCAGYFRKNGFAFDVGATTLVDFAYDGVGDRFLREIGIDGLDGELLDSYQVWLPDGRVTLHRDTSRWNAERLRAFGDSGNHRRFWAFVDWLANAFWIATRRGIKMPISSAADVVRALRCLPPSSWPKARFLNWTMGDALRSHGLGSDVRLRAFLGMLIQDTVQSTVDYAPLINSALGVTMRGAGLSRARGGMFGFWSAVVARYSKLGGDLRLGHRVERIERRGSEFVVHTRRGEVRARQVVSTLPIWNSARLGMPDVAVALTPWTSRDEAHLGGAIVLSMAVRDEDVRDQIATHHQVLVDYDGPLRDGNNMFISVSSPNDVASAPLGHRTVTISTHCDLSPWEDLTGPEYESHKARIGSHLLMTAARVYPRLHQFANRAMVGTPRTYERFTGRYRGAVGGVRLHAHNSNQHAVPYDIGVPGFWQGGDTAWPGLGTVACILASGHIADGVVRAHERSAITAR